MRRILFIITFLSVATTAFASRSAFKKPPVPTLVADYAYVFTDEERQALSSKLIDYSKQSSIDILVYTTSDLQGYSIGEFGQRLGKGWGIGKRGFNKGIVIVYKENSETGPGEITIQLGHGIKPLMSNAVCKQIIDEIMVPKILKGYVYEGIDKAVDMCISLTYLREDRWTRKQMDGSGLRTFIVLIVILVILVCILILALNDRYTTRGRKRGTGLGGFGGGESLSSFASGNFSGGGASGSW